MKIRFLVLRPASPLTPRIKIEIPSGMEVVPAKSRLASAGNVIAKVNIAAVHDRKAQLSIWSMLERTRNLGEIPIDNLEDLKEVLTRGLSTDCDYLITGVRLRRSFGLFGLGYVLYLSRLANCWIARFSWFSLFNDDSRVLCYGK